MSQLRNKANVKLWVDALRSGEYRQGHGELTTLDTQNNILSNCCLGVACEVALKNGVEMTIENRNGRRRYDGNGTDLPPAVQRWLDMPDADTGEYAAYGRDVILSYDPNDDYHFMATTANDSAGWTFDQIANALERRYLQDDSDTKQAESPTVG